MTDAQWTRLADIVPDAMERPAAERAAFLDAACADPATGAPDAALRAEAEALLAAAEAAEATDALASPLAARAAPRVPERVGPYRVTGVLGEGGMGVVYRARRADGTLDREVALKRLHPFLGRALAGRMGAERDTLARLEHDGIARLYDAGLDDDGALFLVMERVEGRPITDYAVAAGLAVRDRVALFAQVCDAVAYAHQNLVVHRDLKPSNVFVTAGEGQAGRVKLLDFGIAKWLGEAESDSLAATLTRTQAAMTPSYAAPEQLRPAAGPVTTATDVYALGVMLYELLAGRRPYALAGMSVAEAERLVCDAEPPPPSAAAEPARARALRGDLDTIVRKAMAKEPARRYASAEALGDDLRRYLGGLPVRARPASAAYRARRFVRRHRTGVAAAVLVALALVAGAALALGQARTARAEAARAEVVNDFLVRLLGAADPAREGRDVRVADLLDRAAADLDTSAGSGLAPAVEAQLRLTLGGTYRELGLYDEAEAQTRRGLALRERLPDRAAAAEAQAALGRLLHLRGDYASADSVLALAIGTLRQARRGTPEQRAQRLSYALTSLGRVRTETGDYEGALALHEEALALDRRFLPPDHIDVLIGQGNVGNTLADLGRNEEAAAMLEAQVAALRRAHPRQDEVIANALANLGYLWGDLGRAEEAAAVQREAVERYRRALGDSHPSVGFGLNNLAATLGGLGRHAEAAPLLQEAIALYGAALGRDHPNLTFPTVNLGRAYAALGRHAEAERLFVDGARLAREGFGATHPVLARALLAHGRALLERGRPTEAAGPLAEALRIYEGAVPDDHPARREAASLLVRARAPR